MVHEIATALLPVFFALALGFGAGLRGYVDNRNVSSINKLVMDFAIPASLFVSISSTDRSDITAHAGYIVVTVVALAAVYAVTLVLQQKAFGLQKAEAAVQALTVAFPNYASIGLPLSAAVVGARGAIAVAIGLAVGAVTIVPFSLALLEDSKLGPNAPGSTLSRFGGALGKSVRRPFSGLRCSPSCSCSAACTCPTWSRRH